MFVRCLVSFLSHEILMLRIISLGPATASSISISNLEMRFKKHPCMYYFLLFYILRSNSYHYWKSKGIQFVSSPVRQREGLVKSNLWLWWKGPLFVLTVYPKAIKWLWGLNKKQYQPLKPFYLIALRFYLFYIPKVSNSISVNSLRR